MDRAKAQSLEYYSQFDYKKNRAKKMYQAY
jgi:hypothetical protein